MCLEDKQCLLKKLHLRSENDHTKEMHAVTHKKENMKYKKEREKYEILEYPTYYSLQARKGLARVRICADAISTFGLTMFYLQQ